MLVDEGMGNSSSEQPKMSIAKVRPISLVENACYERIWYDRDDTDLEVIFEYSYLGPERSREKHFRSIEWIERSC